MTENKTESGVEFRDPKGVLLGRVKDGLSEVPMSKNGHSPFLVVAFGLSPEKLRQKLKEYLERKTK